jgi:ribonuclease HI
VIVNTSEDTPTVIAELHGPIVTDRDSEWDLGSERSTNNTGEVCAQIQALFYIANTTVDTPAAILFDSQYAAQATQGISNAKTNVELIANAREALELARAKCSIDFIHVKGHSADEGNNRADELVQFGKGAGPYMYHHLHANRRGEGEGRFARLRDGRYAANTFPLSPPPTPPPDPILWDTETSTETEVGS